MAILAAYSNLENIGIVNEKTDFKTGIFSASGFTADELGTINLKKGINIICFNITGASTESGTGIVGLQCGNFKIRQPMINGFDVDLELVIIRQTTSNESIKVHLLHHRGFKVANCLCQMVNI